MSSIGRRERLNSAPPGASSSWLICMLSAVGATCSRPADDLMLHHAALKARPGDVLLVDAKGLLGADPWGDVLTAAALMPGTAADAQPRAA